ncbi:MAG: TspO/MBR family protein [Halofilum sp. (in: g-proteobacteria)]|nr:TspO/MBR family protein [Halofilum sp. (in: g-proteobacteria)]
MTNSPATRYWGTLVASLAVCFGAAALGGLVTATSVDGWYRTLARPAFNPPDWIFAPVWNILFLLMAVAAWRVATRATGARRRAALALFALQLAANVLWSVLFFGLQSPAWALADIVVLATLVVATARAFWHIDRVAGALLVPYAAWVGFAVVLNAAIWWLN